MALIGDDKREYQRLWMKARRDEWILENGPCRRCSTWEKLEVDHVDKSTKLMNVSVVWSMSRSNPKRIAELAKCQVLCEECHKIKNNNENFNRVIPHGTGSGYSYHRCRCDLCKAFQRAYDKQKRSRK